MDAACTIQDSIHVFSLVRKYVSRILGTYQKLDKGVLFLNICNSCRGIAEGKRSILETTKSDKMNHGIGLKNVRRIVEKYHGDMEFLCENGSMEADIMIYVKDM